MKRILVLTPLLGLLLILAACSKPEPTPTATPTPPATPIAFAPTTFNVGVGAEDRKQAVTMDSFLPRSLIINEGDTVVFTKKTAEPHTVTFNAPQQFPPPFIPTQDGKLEANPQVFLASPPPQGPPPAGPANLNTAVSFDGTGYLNSGFMQGSEDVFKVTFTRAGTYPVICLLHPSMNGVIMVSQQGTTRTKSSADYSKDAADQLAFSQGTARKLLDNVKVPDLPAGPDGSRTFISYAGAGDPGSGVEAVDFIGGRDLTIKAGDRITWKMEKNTPGTPHTITFLSGQERPGFIVPEPQPQGPPRLIVNDKVVAPAPLPPQPYAGTGYVNSGLLIARGPTAQEFTLQFTKPGKYEYLCLLHDEGGMKGTVTVQAK